MHTTVGYDWVEAKLGNLLDYIQPSRYIVESTDYDDSYETPVLTAGKSFIKGYTNETENIFESLPVIIFDDFTTASQFVNFKFKVKSSAMKILVPSSELVNIKYVYYFMQNIRQNTDTHKRYWISTFSKLPIKISALPEQRAIVAKIEQLFSKLEHGIASFKAAQEKLVLYRRAVLKKAIEGELTQEWREQQTNLSDPNELLTQIKTELDDYQQQQLREWQAAVKVWKAAGKEGKKPARPKKYKGITELTKQDLSRLPELPNEWCWQKLGSICRKIQIGPFGSQMHRHEYVEKGVPIVNPQHIKSQKIFPQVFISKEKAESLPQYVLEENDIILGRRGEMGRSACISAKEQGWFCGSGSLFIRLGKMFIGLLYSLILSERRVVHYLDEKGSGTTMTNLNSTILNELPIQLIPLEEQAQIAKEIETRFSVCDHLQQEIERGLQKAEALRQSVLKKAFEGRLLTEIELADCRAAPDWEPAQQLLARIQVEKRTKQENQLSQ